MNDSLATAERLLTALERFVIQESLLLRSGHFREMAAVQRRASPVIAHLCRLGAELRTSALGGRLEALLERRRENLSGLARRREFLLSERRRLAAQAQRLHRLSPYRRPAVRSRVSGLA